MFCQPEHKVWQLINAVHGNRYSYHLVKFADWREKVTVVCKEHGEFIQSLYQHSRGSECPQCARAIISKKAKQQQSNVMKPVKTQEQAIADLVQNRGTRYDYSKVVYTRDKNNVTIICPDHGDFQQRYNNHLNNGYECPKCARESQKDKARLAGAERSKKVGEKLITKFHSVHRDRYDYSKVVYHNQRTKVTIVCPEHGDFQQYIKHHLKGSGCPTCNNSKGENEIAKWLSDNGINFQQHVSIPKFNPNKFFDFYLPEYNTYIEYDGIQHFEVIPNWGGEERLTVQRYRDNEANKWCKKHQIRLVRIAYNEDVRTRLADELLV